MREFLKRDPNELEVSDFAQDDSFVRWVKHLDPAVDAFWKEWLLEHPEMKDKIEVARNIVLTMEFSDESPPQEEIETEWNKLRQKTIDHSRISDSKIRKLPGTSWRRRLPVAASILFLIAFALTGYLIVNSSDAQEELITRTTLPGQKLSLTLADGTTVRLNSESEIQFPSRFEGTVREVVLKGEAFFDVTHNEQMPFKVHTDDITVVVLGTSFNVDAYPQDDNVSVALEEGRVKVNLNNSVEGKDDIFLKPSEHLMLKKSDHSYAVNHFDPSETTGWKDGKLYLGTIGFNETVMKLERWFGVTIEMDPGFKIDSDWRFAGEFHNKSLPYILDALSYPDLFEYKINGQKVIIY